MRSPNFVPAPLGPGPDAPRPVLFVEPTLIAALNLSGLVQVGTVAMGARTQMPAARMTYIGNDAPLDGWADAQAQVDVWDSDPVSAGRLASSLATYWKSLGRGTVGDAYVSGTWLVDTPRPFPDTDTDAARYMFVIGARIHPRTDRRTDG